MMTKISYRAPRKMALPSTAQIRFKVLRGRLAWDSLADSQNRMNL
jgi:hypothetical protein